MRVKIVCEEDLKVGDIFYIVQPMVGSISAIPNELAYPAMYLAGSKFIVKEIKRLPCGYTKAQIFYAIFCYVMKTM